MHSATERYLLYFLLRWKRRRLPGPYLAAIGAAIAATLALPYGEELLRCMRAERARKALPSPDRFADDARAQSITFEPAVADGLV